MAEVATPEPQARGQQTMRWARSMTLNDLEESAFDAAMPRWDELVLGWEELGVLPTRWKAALAHWRGIYYIFDTSNGKGYVGSAYRQDNILQRWLQYTVSGQGGNALLRKVHINYRRDELNIASLKASRRR